MGTTTMANKHAGKHDQHKWINHCVVQILQVAGQSFHAFSDSSITQAQMTVRTHLRRAQRWDPRSGTRDMAMMVSCRDLVLVLTFYFP